jgi:pilus assembly protein CpaB
LTSLSSGEMVLASHIISPTVKGGPVAFLMEESQVAMAFPAEDILTRNNLLKPGDHVDVLFSIEVTLGEEGGNLVTFNALQNLEVAAIPRATAEGGGAGKPLALVFTLDPQDALVLKHLRDMGGTVDIVLRAPEAEERFTTQPVHMNYLIDRYQLRVPELP